MKFGKLQSNSRYFVCSYSNNQTCLKTVDVRQLVLKYLGRIMRAKWLEQCLVKDVKDGKTQKKFTPPLQTNLCEYFAKDSKHWSRPLSKLPKQTPPDYKTLNATYDTLHEHYI